MDLSVSMTGDLRGLMPCDIMGKPWISELAGCCGVGANFKRALQRFRKFTTLCFRFNVVGSRLVPIVYSGSESAIQSGEGDPATQNGYAAGNLTTANLQRWQTNLSQGGRPCPTSPQSTFILCVIEAISEPTKWYSNDPADAVPTLTGGEFLQANRYQEYFQHEVLRSLGFSYKFDQDGCNADLDPVRFSISGYGKGGLDHASHNGVDIKGNAICLPAWVPIIQSQNDGQPNISKLIVAYDPAPSMALGAIAPAPVANTALVVAQEVTIIMSGFCVPRDVADMMCMPGGGNAVRAWFKNNAFNPTSSTTTTSTTQTTQTQVK